MAALFGRASREVVLKVSNTPQTQNVRMLSFKNLSKTKKAALGLLGTAAVGGIGFATALAASVSAGDLFLHPPSYPWRHTGFFNSYDHHSIRRGYEVYKQVCAACHSMNHVYYRQLVNVIFTEKEAKAEAAEQTYTDGPNQEGEMFERPGKLTDPFPAPYPNGNAAAAANNGAEPPDLSHITQARHDGQNYIFALLTGYKDAPAGVNVGEGQYYNPYFPGGAISMAQALYDEIIEYEDGTPATQSQLSKDVVTFLAWAAQPELDQRKRYLVKCVFIMSFLTFASWYWTKQRWTVVKSKKFLSGDILKKSG